MLVIKFSYIKIIEQWLVEIQNALRNIGKRLENTYHEFLVSQRNSRLSRLEFYRLEKKKIARETNKLFTKLNDKRKKTADEYSILSNLTKPSRVM